ncbi:pilus assembly protein PilP [Lamprobacter modestohalophilus]|uniref:pilus assembly protein PilP n=1 Tax=Lamprobacter modestohalophilus TaxID=1064514 RepID=UPI002ADEBE1F|nr:pilus assembly protein PilP [Lamprobacter modestohalophilus]MEA1049348.1 pilus assembly protein PilP [Lamprobacter modestohalophilus]
MPFRLQRFDGYRRVFCRHMLATFTLLLISACADPGLPELEAYAERVRARPAGPLEPVPEVALVVPFPYLPRERRDPFMMDEQAADVAQRRNPSGISPDPLRRKEPLEGYSLDSLRMVGTLEQDQTRWALIMAPDGMLHRVRTGNYLGRNDGKIIRVDPTELLLTEIIEKAPGEWDQRQASMALKQ